LVQNVNINTKGAVQFEPPLKDEASKNAVLFFFAVASQIAEQSIRKTFTNIPEDTLD